MKNSLIGNSFAHLKEVIALAFFASSMHLLSIKYSGNYQKEELYRLAV